MLSLPVGLPERSRGRYFSRFSMSLAGCSLQQHHPVPGGAGARRPGLQLGGSAGVTSLLPLAPCSGR